MKKQIKILVYCWSYDKKTEVLIANTISKLNRVSFVSVSGPNEILESTIENTVALAIIVANTDTDIDSAVQLTRAIKKKNFYFIIASSFDEKIPPHDKTDDRLEILAPYTSTSLLRSVSIRLKKMFVTAEMSVLVPTEKLEAKPGPKVVNFQGRTFALPTTNKSTLFTDKSLDANEREALAIALCQISQDPRHWNDSLGGAANYAFRNWGINLAVISHFNHTVEVRRFIVKDSGSTTREIREIPVNIFPAQRSEKGVLERQLVATVLPDVSLNTQVEFIGDEVNKFLILTWSSGKSAPRLELVRSLVQAAVKIVERKQA